MSVYVWKGLSPKGKEIKGVRDAESVKALRGLLKREGILVTEALEEEKARKVQAREIDFKRYFQRVSIGQVGMLTRQLATLLKSGVPLVESLTALIEQLEEEPLMRTALTQVRDKVNEGSSLHDALKAHPKMFSTLYVSMVDAGEASGTLEHVLLRLADFLEAQSKLSGKVASAIAYPAFMALTGIMTIGILMVVVVPKITTIFQDFRQALPWYTRLLIFTSNIVTGWEGLVVLALVIIAAWQFRKWQQSVEGRAKWDRWILSWPLFGKLFLQVSVSRFARTLATLLRSGVPVLTAMEITRNVLGNVELMKVIDEAALAVREGDSLAQPLKRSKRFPPIVVHMIAVGERSGQLEEMLENVANAYDLQVERQVETMTRLLEPLLIVVMGGLSGGIAFAILVPLMQMNQFVQ